MPSAGKQVPSSIIKSVNCAFRNRSISGLKPKWSGFGHLGFRSLCVGFCTCERVSAKISELANGNPDVSGPERDDRALVIALRVLTCRFLG